MNHHDEIKELKQAFAISPDNQYLLNMLIGKMEKYAAYDEELEEVVQNALKRTPNNVGLKEKLINVYFRQNKLSICIIIAEEIGHLTQLQSNTQSNIAKCYLREGNKGEASNIYRTLIGQFKNFVDEELDAAFRLGTASQEEELNEADAKLLSKPSINFSDVGGMSAIKREIDLKIIKPLENADLYASYGKKIGGGILLYGPPGCGKTFIAKATAGEINASFINITLNDILDMWVGQSEKNLNKYFGLARKKKPCVLFFDEVDALGAKRSDMRMSAGKNVINQFLAELDGMEADNDGLLIIGATNAPWQLDSAFLRPGRFDRIIFVPPPDEKSKEAILQLKLKNKPQKNIDYLKVARKSKDFSGADLNAIIDIAVEAIIEQALQTGVPRPIETNDLLKAIKKHRASTTEWFTTARNYALFANKSGLYDDVLKYIK